MTPDRLLMLVAAEAARDGMLAPQLDSEQARHAAERLLAAVGLARPEPPRQLAGPPAPTAVMPRAALAEATQYLPLVPRPPAPRDRFARGVAR